MRGRAGLRRSALLRSVPVAAFAIGVMLALLPLPPVMVSPGLDASWQQALHVAAQQRLSFGEQVIFTYGPLGFVHARIFWPGLFGVTIFFWMLLATALLDAWRGAAAGGGKVAIGAAALLYGSFALSSMYTFDAVVLAYLLLWVWSVEGSPHSAGRLAAHGAMLGLLALSKLTFGLAALAAVAAAVIILAVRASPARGFVALMAGALVFLGGWFALGQELAALPAYVSNGLEIVRGYGEAMSLRGPVWEMRLFGFAMLVVVALVAFVAVRRRDPGMAAAVAFTVASVALAWKQAFTRHDEHAFLAFTFGCAAAGCIASRLAREAPRSAAAAGLVAAAFLAVALGTITLRGGMPLLAVVGEVVNRPLAAARALRETGEWHARHDAAYASIRASHPLPRLEGSVDVYSHGQAIAFAHGLRWNPRPVFQSYSAYTPALAAANRAHLLGADAPRHALVRVEAIDGRFPALEDGASWLPLLERYQVREEGDFLVLDRAPQARPARRRALEPWRGRGWASLPADAVIVVAALDVEMPRRGPGSIFKGSPMLDIEVRLAGEAAVRRYRFLPSVARTPFAISPLVETHHDLADVFLPCKALAPRRVEAIRILDSGGRELDYTARFEAIEALPGFPEAPAARAREALCRLQRAENEAQPAPAIIGDARGRGLNVHPPSRLRPRAPVRAIEVCTRLASPPAGTRGRSNGYVLRLVRVPSARIVASREVREPELAEEACVAARFPSPVDDLEFRVDARGDPQWDWVYVSRLRLDE